MNKFQASISLNITVIAHHRQNEAISRGTLRNAFSFFFCIILSKCHANEAIIFSPWTYYPPRRSSLAKARKMNIFALEVNRIFFLFCHLTGENPISFSTQVRVCVGKSLFTWINILPCRKEKRGKENVAQKKQRVTFLQRVGFFYSSGKYANKNWRLECVLEGSQAGKSLGVIAGGRGKNAPQEDWYGVHNWTVFPGRKSRNLVRNVWRTWKFFNSVGQKASLLCNGILERNSFWRYCWRSLFL